MSRRASRATHRSRWAGGASTAVPAGGFTLLELVIVLGLFALIAGLSAQPLRQALQAAFTAQQISDQQAAMGAALDRMARDVRGAGDGTGAPAACSGGSELLVPTPDGDLRYFLRADEIVHESAGGEEERLIGGPDLPVADFACEDAGNGLTADCLIALRIDMEGTYEGETVAAIRDCL